MLDSEKTVFLRFNNTIVLIAGIYHSIAIEPKDSFGNVTEIDQSEFDIEIRKVNHYYTYTYDVFEVEICMYRMVLMDSWLIQNSSLIKMPLPSMNCF